MGMRTQINWGVFAIFGVIILGFVIAGLLVSPDARTDDGHPLNIFFFVMAGLFLLTNAAVIAWATLANRKRELREMTWLDATAEILDVRETGTYVNNQPRIRFSFLVHSPVHPPCKVVHRQVMPLTVLSEYRPGSTINIKVDPRDPRKVHLL